MKTLVVDQSESGSESESESESSLSHKGPCALGIFLDCQAQASEKQ